MKKPRYATVEEVKEIAALLESGHTISQVRQITGRGRSLVESISAGRHYNRYGNRNPHSWRCPTCRGLIETPKCILCEVRSVSQSAGNEQPPRGEG